MSESGTSERPLRVSIGLPVYNGEDYLEPALESLLTQTLSEFELIISDNGSTDRTQSICEAAAGNDSRVRYLRHERNRGAAWNYNLTVHEAKAPLFKWAAHDDLCEPTFLEACVAELKRAPEAVLCYPKSYHTDEHGQIQGVYTENLNICHPTPQERLQAILRMNSWFHGSQAFGVMRTEVLRKTGMIGCYPHADGVFIAELALHGEFHEVPEFLFHRRFHPNTSMTANRTNRELCNWYGGAVRFPGVRRRFEYCMAINRAPQGLAGKLRCYGSLIGQIITEKHDFHLRLLERFPLPKRSRASKR